MSPIPCGYGSYTFKCLDTDNLAGTTWEGLKNWLIAIDPMQLLKNYLLFMYKCSYTGNAKTMCTVFYFVLMAMNSNQYYIHRVIAIYTLHKDYSLQ